MVFDIIPKFNLKTTEKFCFKSYQYRFWANQQFNCEHSCHPFETLRMYNMSIAYAQSKDQLALGYANRSAVYLEAGFYKECLENIQLARNNNYPADKLSKLDEREAKCKKLMTEDEDESNEDLWVVFDLSYPPNKNIPFIADCVELKQTSNGHGIFATRDIKAGDVISNEESVVYFLREESYYERCFNCFKSNSLNLIPCDKTASLMFCSKECKKSTYRKAINMEKIKCDDIKLLSELIAAFGSKKKFIGCFKDLKELNKTIFDYDLSNPEDPDYKKNLMMCLLSSANKNAEKPLNCQSSNIKDILPSEIAEKLVEILYSNNQLEPFLANMHQGKRDLEYSRENGCDPSIPLFASLIQRGRAGNVFSVLPGNKIVVIAMKPIKKGRQIFFSNNNHFELMGYGNNYDYDKAAIFSFDDWDLLEDYSDARKFIADEWKLIKLGCKTPSIDCYPTGSIDALRSIAAACTFPMNT